MKHGDKVNFMNLKIGDRFAFPKDYNKRIVSTVIKKHGYITTYIRKQRKCKSFHCYTEVIFINEATDP